MQKFAQAASGYGGPNGGAKDHEKGAFNYEEITYVKDMKKQMNFSYM